MLYSGYPYQYTKDCEGASSTVARLEAYPNENGAVSGWSNPLKTQKYIVVTSLSQRYLEHDKSYLGTLPQHVAFEETAHTRLQHCLSTRYLVAL